MRAIAVLVSLDILGSASAVLAQGAPPSTPSAPGLTPTPPPPLTPPPLSGGPGGGAPPPPTSDGGAPPPAANVGTITTLTTFSIGNWSAGAYSVPGSMAFDHCAASAEYKSGITLIFAVSRTFQWSMGMYNSAWQLSQDTSYQVTYAIDGSGPTIAKAVAIGPSQVEIPLAPNETLFQRFMRGNQLTINAASQNFLFDLTKTIELLPDLLSCVENYVGKAPPSNNPFVAGR
jgi:hypothetical protein